MKVFIVAIIVAIGAVATANPPKFNYIDGKCPSSQGLEKFEISKFTGRWYSVRDSDASVPCVYYDIIQNDEESFTSVKHPINITTTAHKVTKDSFADGFVFKSHLPLYDGTVLKIHAIDYDNYAAGYICKETKEGKHFLLLSYWSRSKTLSSAALAAMDEATAKFKDLSKLVLTDRSQDDCPN